MTVCEAGEGGGVGETDILPLLVLAGRDGLACGVLIAAQPRVLRLHCGPRQLREGLPHRRPYLRMAMEVTLAPPCNRPFLLVTGLGTRGHGLARVVYLGGRLGELLATVRLLLVALPAESPRRLQRVCGAGRCERVLLVRGMVVLALNCSLVGRGAVEAFGGLPVLQARQVVFMACRRVECLNSDRIGATFRVIPLLALIRLLRLCDVHGV